MAKSPIPDKVPPRLVRCAFAGCPKTSVQPALDGWVGIASRDHPNLSGRYCPEHGRALEAVLDAGDDDEDDKDV